MKRRGFLKALGLAPVVAAVKPAEAERPPMRHYVDPELDDKDRATIQDTMEEMGWGKSELIDAPKEADGWAWCGNWDVALLTSTGECTYPGYERVRGVPFEYLGGDLRNAEPIEWAVGQKHNQDVARQFAVYDELGDLRFCGDLSTPLRIGMGVTPVADVGAIVFEGLPVPKPAIAKLK